MKARIACSLGLLAMFGCGDDAGKPPLTQAELLDPESCKGCHPSHYAEWSGSMHAYAMRDPVFQAMNKRGQEETGGELGPFCLNCHAPMAVRTNAIGDFADLSDVPRHLQGVTCYFCHNVASVGEPHNNAVNITLANDIRMRAGLTDPLMPFAHRVGYSRQLDSRLPESTLFCGSCHDIEMPNGFHLERTLQEHQESVFIDRTCSSCHTRTKEGEPAAVYPGVGGRITHEHTWPAVDLALDDFPQRAAQHSLVEKCMFGERTQVLATVSPAADILAGEYFAFDVLVETANVAHKMPSGASQDRRMWLEVHGYDAKGAEVFTSGLIGDQELEEKPLDHSDYDRQLLMFRDVLLDEDGKETHMFWRAASRDESRGRTLPTTTSRTLNDHSVRWPYATQLLEQPKRFELFLRMRPMGMDVLKDLVESGHLEESVLGQMKTLTVASWEFELAPNGRDYRGFDTQTQDCESFKDLLEYPD